MKIVAFSDVHWLYQQVSIPSCDLLIYAGDWCYGNDLKNTITFSSYLSKIKAKQKIIVPGNHDIIAQTNMPMVKAILGNAGATVLCDSACTCAGISIYGTPWTPMFGNWAFMKEDDELKDVFVKIPKGVDILITHGPCYGILDTTDSMKHVGSYSLLDAVSKRKPKIHICGHIHSGYGKQESDATTFYNVSVLNDDYKVVNEPTIIDL